VGFAFEMHGFPRCGTGRHMLGFGRCRPGSIRTVRLLTAFATRSHRARVRLRMGHGTITQTCTPFMSFNTHNGTELSYKLTESAVSSGFRSSFTFKSEPPLGLQQPGRRGGFACDSLAEHGHQAKRVDSRSSLQYTWASRTWLHHPCDGHLHSLSLCSMTEGLRPHRHASSLARPFLHQL